MVKVATGSVHRAAGDGDVFAVGEGAADAGSTTTVATGSVHRAAGDGDVFAVAKVTAADAGTIVATGSRQAAGFVIIVLQGQRTCGGFFKARPAFAAFQLVIAVQLDLHIALSLNTQGSLSSLIILKLKVVTSGVAHIDLYVFQGEVQHLIGKVVDHRNGVAPKAIILFVHRSRACRGSSRGCLLGLGLLSAFMLVGAFRFLGALRLVCTFRFLSALRLSRLVVVLRHRAKAGILCCGAFQVALQRGDDRIRGGDDGLLPGLVRPFLSALFDGLAAILIFGDGNITVVDVVGICKGRNRQRYRDAQRCHQSCCPAECVVLLHRSNLLSLS